MTSSEAIGTEREPFQGAEAEQGHEELIGGAGAEPSKPMWTDDMQREHKQEERLAALEQKIFDLELNFSQRLSEVAGPVKKDEVGVEGLTVTVLAGVICKTCEQKIGDISMTGGQIQYYLHPFGNVMKLQNKPCPHQGKKFRLPQMVLEEVKTVAKS